MYLNLLPATNYIDPRGISKSSPFRFVVGSANGKTADDERLALLDRFRSEGLDFRKINDAQKLLFVWRWLGDAEINCQSLRHQIEKMRVQHDEELREVEDYIEQVWKLSTERLILLEEENKCLREKQTAEVSSAAVAAEKSSIKPASSRRYSQDNNNLLEEVDADEEDAEDSDGELEKCLYGSRSHGKASQHRRAHLVETDARAKGNLIVGPNQQQPLNRNSGFVNSSSTSSLASSISMSNGLNLCDSLKLRSSRSCWQLGATDNGTADIAAVDSTKGVDLNSNKVQTKYCEKCEILDAELVELRQKCVDLESALDDANEKNFVLEKLNRSIEMENENFAYKLAETEDRSNQMERRILNLEKECRNQKSKGISDDLVSSVGLSGTSKLAKLQVYSQNDQSIRRLIDELNHKIKDLEEELDHRVQLYEELEMKYEKQKAKQHETLWKLRNYIQDGDIHTQSNEHGNGGLRIDDLALFDDDKMTISSSNDSGHITFDHIHHRPKHRTMSIHDKLV